MSLKVSTTPTWFVEGSHQESGSVVSSTKNYDRFSFDPVQRPVNQKHVDELVEAIKHRNLLREYPIVVDVNFKIIDGQHRLRAAQALGVPLFYIISKSMTATDVATVNRHQSGWKHDDYLHSFCAQGKSHYLALQEFQKSYPFLSISICRLLLGGRAQQSTKIFQEGGFTVTRPDLAVKVANHLVEIGKFTTLHDRWQFVDAVINMVANPLYSTKRMIQKLGYLSGHLHRCVDCAEYLSMLSEIYNYKVKPNEVVQFVSLSKTKSKKYLTKRG